MLRGNPIIQTESLTKYYGKARGIVDVNLAVEQGEVFGFLGPNGAGSRPPFACCWTSSARPADAQRSFGLDAHKDALAIHARTGILPGDFALYPRLTGEENLRYLANLRGGVDWTFVRQLADRLEADLSKQVKAYSSGNRQKIGLIQAFMHRPELLILDEPTNGLDPLIQQEFYALVREAINAGQTVFLSSHNLPEVERVCDRVGIIREGQLVAVEQVSALKAKALRQIELVFDGPAPLHAFEQLPGVRDVVASNSHLRCTVAGSLDPVIKQAAQYTVVNMISQDPNLEDIFLAFYGKEGNNHA